MNTNMMQAMLNSLAMKFDEAGAGMNDMLTEMPFMPFMELGTLVGQI